MSEGTELFTIGQLARRTGLAVRTIRFWSDSGLVPPTGRSAGGYRLYDARALARLDLVRTLRELGFGLEAVEEILCRATTVAQVAETHVAALEAEIRTLRLRRAVLSTVARRGSTIEEASLMHRLARLSARERQQIIDDFVDRVLTGVDPQEGPAVGIANGMRQVNAELPDDPSPEQVDAWMELADLVEDEDFQHRVRQMVVVGQSADTPAHQPDHQAVIEHAGRAEAEGVAPDSAEGRAVLDLIVAPETTAEERVRLAEQVETFSDLRVERYWQLMGVINGRPPFPPAVAAFLWLAAALRASARA
ncbi:helix-turn-helix domain-containing protein [Streptosporangium saharense]|uniref:DNA-binding transcriptional MerR regulator n=1 Tax=Streptosporangium saharense TaxID=1706840 RepID=A0A7W7VN97_9ACTN|nr:MerR family transcriptional regulator [Streptosporangium saharense]MBB4916274.1 DNA-binding transcriptional MerR regulator [Streptosporangium saharense]